ncbi:SagB family peptide dehydrogenase [Peribacillus sp. NPDC097675]|uniref:SagB family peptide dehydrogenase n=1 Tax=Peribacillus sp. NPDC097675 TaxID=3390618 RepID=UPI003CFECF5A
MKLDQFLYNLQFDTEKVRPPDWEVDWEDAPLSYKLYRDLPVFPFSSDVPLTLETCEASSPPDFNGIGHFLWYVFGLTQVSQFMNESEKVEYMQTFRRFAPSGGALYPNELYVYLKIVDLPVGVYHYDVAHHRLALLREGNFDDYLDQALGNRCDMSASFGTVFVSTMFWKNFYKYNDFSYRLQGLDAGVLIGQLLEVAKRFGFSTGVAFQFLDRAINHLIGLSEQEESAYAIIPLYAGPSNECTFGSEAGQTFTATELCEELPAISCQHYVRSKRIKKYPMLLSMNEASMIDSTQSFRRIMKKEEMNGKEKEVHLPPVERLPYDLAAVCRKRFSPEMDFSLSKVSQVQLATLLKEATDSYSYTNDLDGERENSNDLVTIYACLHQVEGISDGAYYYDRSAHSLRQVELGDFRVPLQYALSLDNVNLQQVPLCLHVAGNKDYLKNELGYRGYRIQQMAAGMLVQRLLLAATALGMGGHPLLGFDVNVCDDIYRMGSLGKTSLIQIPIGPYRGRPWLKGSLHS